MANNKARTMVAVTVFKDVKEWKVGFNFNHQYFTLDYGGTKAEATWMAKMLRKCMLSFKDEILANARNKDLKKKS